VLIIPVGGTYTQAPHEAAATVKLLSPKLVIPVHSFEIDGNVCVSFSPYLYNPK